MTSNTVQPCSRCGAPNTALAKFCRQCGARLTAIQSVTRETPLLARWRAIRRDLTRRESRALLGEPLRIEPPVAEARDGHERWVYEYESTTPGQRIRGVLVFSAAEGRLLSWSEPDWALLEAPSESRQ
ncbi:MAG: zinc ribbon domain-containing protein [Phycisphaerae bacterium]